MSKSNVSRDWVVVAPLDEVFDAACDGFGVPNADPGVALGGCAGRALREVYLDVRRDYFGPPSRDLQPAGSPDLDILVSFTVNAATVEPAKSAPAKSAQLTKPEERWVSEETRNTLHTLVQSSLKWVWV
uniref:Uncharacterized protein n=1 Tax=Marseillevirus LCMAC103 TaxID=2506604 RepID=A0A481YVI2_9VIRU|nr:MAG: hypothetical protein LCMAC103_03940 [Marseillevirus LCMAC103]